MNQATGGFWMSMTTAGTGWDPWRYLVWSAVCAFAFAGCATTEMTTYAVPNVQPSSYNQIVVLSFFKDLETRSILEKEFATQFEAVGLNADDSLDYLPPTQQFEVAEMAKRLHESDADAVLMVVLTDAQEETITVVPPSAHTRGSGTVSGNMTRFNATTTYSRGHYLSKPTVRFNLQLIDLEKKRTLWVASSETRGNAYADFSDLSQSTAKEVATQLLDDGVLKAATQK